MSTPENSCNKSGACLRGGLGAPPLAQSLANSHSQVILAVKGVENELVYGYYAHYAWPYFTLYTSSQGNVGHHSVSRDDFTYFDLAVLNCAQCLQSMSCVSAERTGFIL